MNRDAAAAQAMMDRHLSRYQIDEQALRLKYPNYFLPKEEAPSAAFIGSKTT